MRIEFSDEIPASVTVGPVLISGADTVGFPYKKYILVKPADRIEFVYEIRFEVQVGPFEQAEIFESLLVVGINQDFYLYNYSGKFSIAHLRMESYFGRFSIYKGQIYVADANTLRCVDKAGRTKWQSQNLAIDGVIIHDMDDEKMVVHGQYDPPDGWDMFILDTKTGRTISTERL